jgi:sulfane dehydrogenase subunit SoxC
MNAERSGSGADLESVSLPSRTAEPGEGISPEELGLAARNHAFPTEALRWEITPPGLHYVLTHYDIPDADPVSWILAVTGEVEREQHLTLEHLASMEQHTVRVTMECAGNGRAGVEPRPVSQPWINGAVGTADWSGVRVRDLLTGAGLTADAVDVVFRGADHGVERGVEQDYERGLPLPKAVDPDLLIATSMNGQPLPPQHGFPLRLLVPGWYGMTSVKWLRRITAVADPFEGFQMDAYRLRQEADDMGVPVTRMLPRALMVPPGFPDFFERTRTLDAGLTTLEGRAWSGSGLVTGVEVSADGGVRWADAALEPSAGPYAWRRWTFGWTATPGEHELAVRATDDAGNIQPIDAPWNHHGLANNMAQLVKVSVR